jgi:hypothetical protein
LFLSIFFSINTNFHFSLFAVLYQSHVIFSINPGIKRFAFDNLNVTELYIIIIT